MEKLKKKISQAFKLSGYTIRSDSSSFLAEQLSPFDSSEHEKWITTVIENIQNLKLESANIDRPVIEKAIGEINRVGLQEDETIFGVIDAFRVPRYIYNILTKKFQLDKSPRSILPHPEMQISYLRHRYDMLYQKTIRHELFSPSIIQKSNSEDAKKFKLYHAENLLASSEVKEAVILGQLNQIKEGKYFIEDPTGFVEVDLSEARYHSGFFCEGSFVLAEGSYDNKIFKVDGLGFPPAEPATSSRAFFGTANSWGGPSPKLLKYSIALQEAERSNTEATMVFLSDVQLDVHEVVNRLRRLFVGYDSCPPICIVLMGPFSTATANYYDLVPLFKKLAQAANGCDQLKKQTDLIIVPHIYDPMEEKVLPRMSIPDNICADLLKAWPRTKLASNPCRLQYCTQQIVVFRMDLMARLARNAIHFPGTKDIDDHFARTLICQGHLTPLSRYANPIHWDFDSSLWLYPLPDLVVIGDSCQSFNITQHGCTIVNTGSFLRSNFSFKMYIPSLKTIEDSEIPAEGEENLEEEEEEEVIEIPEEDEDYPENRIFPNNGLEGFVEGVKVTDKKTTDEPDVISEISEKIVDLEIPEDSNANTEQIVDDTEMPAVDTIDYDNDLPSVSGISREDINKIVSATMKPAEEVEDENEQLRKKIIEQLELPSESESEEED